MRLPKNTPEILRRHGLTVVEIPGWEDRGRDPEHGAFTPVGSLNHHTGSYDALADAKDDYDYAVWLATKGRPDLPPPLANFSTSREGVVYVLAAGRANHAGTAKARGSVAAGDGNTLYVGTEHQNSGIQGWSDAQYGTLILLNAVICAEILHTSEKTVAAHYETSVTGKWDPGDPKGVDFGGHKVMDMRAVRAKVKAKIEAISAPPARPTGPDATRIQTFRGQSPRYDMRLLDAAAARRPGVARVRDGIDEQMARLDKARQTDRVKDVRAAYRQRDLRLGLLAQAVSKDGLTGVAEDVLTHVRALIKSLPTR